MEPSFVCQLCWIMPFGSSLGKPSMMKDRKSNVSLRSVAAVEINFVGDDHSHGSHRTSTVSP